MGRGRKPFTPIPYAFGRSHVNTTLEETDPKSQPTGELDGIHPSTESGLLREMRGSAHRGVVWGRQERVRRGSRFGVRSDSGWARSGGFPHRFSGKIPQTNTVLETNTGGEVKHTKVNERTQLKELCKITS